MKNLNASVQSLLASCDEVAANLEEQKALIENQLNAINVARETIRRSGPTTGFATELPSELEALRHTEAARVGRSASKRSKSKIINSNGRPLRKTQEKLFDAFRAFGGKAKVEQVAIDLGKDGKVVSVQCQIAVRGGFLKRVEKGIYALTKKAGA